MKTLKLFAAVILLPFIAVAQIKTANTFTVHVIIKSAKINTRVYLAYQVDGKKIIDSATLNNGIYTLSGPIEHPLNATLINDSEGLGIPVLMKKVKTGLTVDAFKFYIHAGTFTIKTDKLIADATVTGSVINADNERLKAKLKPIEDEQLSISNQLRAGNYVYKGNEERPTKTLSADEIATIHKLTARLDTLKTAVRPIFKQFIQANPNSYISLITLQDYAGPYPDLAVIDPMFNNLSPVVRNTIIGKQYQKFLTDCKNMVAGTKAPDFTQTDTIDKPVSLSSFRGKYVLLDFWASWCGPCRADNPELVKLYNDFKDKNFTILGISLDAADGKKSWLKAIKDDHLNWAQVSDLRHWDNRVAKLYSVGAIPESFLIDPNGIIIAKGMDHQQLRKKLEEILLK